MSTLFDMPGGWSDEVDAAGIPTWAMTAEGPARAPAAGTGERGGSGRHTS